MHLDDKEDHLKTFSDLLYDSVYLLYFSFDINPDDYKDDVIGSFNRASVLNSILLLESGANCLIDALDLPGKYYQDIERLPFLSKFEFFLNHVKPGKFVDRGVTEVQAISELKSIRDFYVHPKVKKAKYERIGEYTWNAEHGETTLLKFPRNPVKWNRDNAIVALKSVNDFYNLYLLDWCELSSNTVIDLLIGNEKTDLDSPSGGAIDAIGGLDRAVEEWGIDFKFIGKNV